MSISTCRSRVRFWIYLWIINHLVMKLSQLIGVVKSNICRKQWFRGLGPRSRPILIYKSTEINQKPIMMSLQFWKCTLRQSKVVNIILKTNRSHYIVIWSKSWKGLELVSSLPSTGKKKLEIRVISCTNSYLMMIRICLYNISFWYLLGF